MVLSNRIPLLTVLAASLLASCSEAKKAPPPKSRGGGSSQTASRDRKARGRGGREPEPGRQSDLDDTVRRSASPAGERGRALPRDHHVRDRKRDPRARWGGARAAGEGVRLRLGPRDRRLDSEVLALSSARSASGFEQIANLAEELDLGGRPRGGR